MIKKKIPNYNKYPFKITKILNNNLLQGKITYDKSDIVITIKLYEVNFLCNKIGEVKKKIYPLMKRKDLEFEILEINNCGIYEGHICYANNTLLNEELVTENLTKYEYKEKVNVEENRKELLKIIEEYENRCTTLNITSILEIVEYRRNKKFKKSKKINKRFFVYKKNG